MIGGRLNYSITYGIESPMPRRRFALSANARRYAVAFALGAATGAVWTLVAVLLT